MRIGCRIQDNPVELPLRLLNPAHQLSLQVRLPELKGKAVPPRRLSAQRFDVTERGVAVFLGLAASEQVQIGAVDDVDAVRHRRGDGVQTMARRCGYTPSSVQQTALPQRAMLTLERSASRPTAPITTSEPMM